MADNVTEITPESNQEYISRAIMRLKLTRAIIRNSTFTVEFKNDTQQDRHWIEIEGDNIAIYDCHFIFREVEIFFDEEPISVLAKASPDRALRKIDG